MAGRNQHFIPQLLQKGFSTRTKRGQHQVWVFRRGQHPFQTNTRNAFAEKDFYGSPSEALVDDLITGDELRLEAFVIDLRQTAQSRTIGPNDSAADFVLLIRIRVRWLRDFFEIGVRHMLERMSAALGNSAGVARWLQAYSERNPGWLLKELLANFTQRRQRPLTTEEQAELSTLASQVESHPEKLAELQDFRPFIEAMKRFREQLGTTTAKAHIKALEVALRSNETEFRRLLRGFTWSVYFVKPPHKLLLGDCGPLELDASGNPQGPIGITERGQVSAVALPISSSQLLIGRLRPISCPDPDIAVLNQASAGWSHDAFIASANTAVNVSLQRLIDQKVQAFLESLWPDIFREIGI